MIDDKWLDFVLIENKPKTKVYSVISKCSDDELGIIKWYPSWRHYCFFPTIDIETVHSDRCLLAISEFITRLNEEHKKQRDERSIEKYNKDDKNIIKLKMI